MVAIKKQLMSLSLSVVAITGMLLPGYTDSALAEDYFVTQGYLHSFDKLNVFTGVFALNKDVTYNSTIYFKYATDMISTENTVTNTVTTTTTTGGGTTTDVTATPSARVAPRSIIGRDDDGEDEGEGREDRDREDDGGGGGSDTTRTVTSEETTTDTTKSTETRRELSLGYTYRTQDYLSIQPSIYYSSEDDYTSMAPSITIKKEFNNRNTTLSLSYSHAFDTVDGSLMTSSEDRSTDSVYLGLTQVLTPVAIAQFGYTHASVSGRLSDGNKSVVLDSGQVVNETLPDSRSRNAIMLGTNIYLGRAIPALGRSALQLRVRYYTDDWDINGLSGEVKFLKYLSEKSLLTLNYRGYSQSSASFQKATYSAADQYKSASSSNEEFTSSMFGAKMSFIFDSFDPENLNKWYFDVSYERYSEQYDDRSVDANVIMVGVRIDF